MERLVSRQLAPLISFTQIQRCYGVRIAQGKPLLLTLSTDLSLLQAVLADAGAAVRRHTLFYLIV